MTAIAIIPARGGSKGVPLKNLLKVGGKTLIRRCVETCHAAGCFERVLVSSEHREVLAEARDAGAYAVSRPEVFATDACRSDPVLLHALLAYLVDVDAMPDVTAFVQCTCPLMTPEDVRECVDMHTTISEPVCNGLMPVFYRQPRIPQPDLTVQVVESHAIFADEVCAVSPRRQERPPRLEVAGTVWALNTRTFLERGTVYGGSTQYHVTQTPKLDIDTEADLRLAEMLLAERGGPDVPVPDWYEYVGME